MDSTTHRLLSTIARPPARLLRRRREASAKTVHGDMDTSATFIAGLLLFAHNHKLPPYYYSWLAGSLGDSSLAVCHTLMLPVASIRPPQSEAYLIMLRRAVPEQSTGIIHIVVLVSSSPDC